MIKSFTSWFNQLAVGDKLIITRSVEHKERAPTQQTVNRTIVKKQTNAIASAGEGYKEGQVYDAKHPIWWYKPKTSDVKIVGDTIVDKSVKWCTITLKKVRNHE